MSRNNQSRLNAPQPAFSVDPVGAFAPTQINISVPSEFVELPSRGIFYPPSHPLHGKQSIEIKHMTAREEDILASESLIKKGVVLDRLIQSLVLDSKVDPSTILICDRNAILYAARSSAYGPSYEATLSCPQCGEKNEVDYDLDSFSSSDVTIPEDVKVTQNGTLVVTLPKSGKQIEFRLLNGRDEGQNFKGNQANNSISEQLKRVVVSVDSNDDPGYTQMFCENMPAFDSRFLRKAIKNCTPSTDLKFELRCTSCGHQEEVEVPIGIKFFWPDA